MDQTRILPLKGIRNFRDYGGYAGVDGAIVKRRVLWRSGHHHEASADDLEQVAGLGLAAVIDLRGDSERALYPCARHPEFGAAVLYEPGETAGLAGAAAHEAAGVGVRNGDEARRAMIRLNEGLPGRPVLVATMKMYFSTLASGEGPTLLHCVAGKDRTGLAASLAHHILGVHPDDALADYLLTNVAADVDGQMAGGSAKFRARYGPDMEDEAVRAMIGVAPEYIAAAHSAIRERHGDLDTYLDAVLGVDEAQRAAIRAQLLA